MEGVAIGSLPLWLLPWGWIDQRWLSQDDRPWLTQDDEDWNL